MVDDRVPAESTCLVCTSKDVFVFYKAKGVPVHCNLLCRSRAEALAVPRGDIRLALCRACGFIANLAFEPQRMQYSQAYENSLHCSPRFQAYANGLATRLIERYDLRDKDIIEIACGNGEFLMLLCERGDNRGVGFDPAYVPQTAPARTNGQTSFIQDFYSERYADRLADFICCRHALEHMPDPVAFLRMVRRNIGQHDTVVFFEVPNVLFTLRDLGIWDIIYEHCTYFCPTSLARCFRIAGFDVMAVAEEYQGQFTCIEAEPGQENTTGTGDGDGNLAQITADVQEFGTRYQTRINEWTERLDQMRKAGKRAVVWGAGSKGVTFLNVLPPADLVEYVVDINPRKYGMYIVGTGQRIVPPDFLRRYRPDAAIVMNPIYADEVQAQIKHLDLNVDLLTA